ncbi:MAG TPA: metallophosphoesterase [Allosphingosinicella sp.]|nr:metallophosphoesterase [Allosphingosinicella sp.]
MRRPKEFSWIHLSDIHVGLTPHGWLWPALKTALFDDIARLFEKQGGWDAIIFSGDFTQQSLPDEYKQLDCVLGDLWEHFDKLGFSPALFPVPGNHDLVRAGDDPAPLLLRRWWSEPTVQERMWDNDSPYREVVKTAFAGYQDWLENSTLVKPKMQVREGVLPGDISARLEIGTISIGLVGLNSAWLQLADDDYEGQLHVDVRQILGVTNGNADSWCSANDINVLVTHHPPSWLHQESLQSWRSEINPPGRFDMHLYGHMHTAAAITQSEGGSDHRTTLQAASIFGLEKLPDGTTERLHGYSAGRITLETGRRRRSIWPRKLQEHASGKRRLIPDHSFELNEDNAFVEIYKIDHSIGRLRSGPRSREIAVDVAPADSESATHLDKISYRLTPAPPHIHVRLPEQNQCIRQLQDKRIIWLSAGWGMGADEFLWAIREGAADGHVPTFHFDLQAFSTRERYLDHIKQSFGSTFEQLCELISRQSKTYVLFDNVPVEGHSEQGGSVEIDVEAMAAVLLEYCPQAKIVLRSRIPPQYNAVPSVNLTPLDEADTGSYILHSPLGGSRLSNSEAVAKLHRHTDGVPARIDTALRELQVVRLSELVGANSDFSAGSSLVAAAPVALIQAVSDLRNAADPFLKRCFELLKTLSTFPQGEQLESVRHFNNADPFFIQHATQLGERGLITVAPLPELGPTRGEDNPRVLSVPKEVRDFVRTVLDGEEARSLDRRALNLYFGEKWSTGSLVFPRSHRFDEPLQSSYKISNASALVMRLVRQALGGGDSDSVASALRVASSYVAALLRGDHYRSVTALCSDLFDALAEDGHERDVAYIRAQYGRSLRMIGDAEQARSVLRDLDLALLPKPLRQSALLNLALSCQALGEDEAAVAAAEATIKLGRHEVSALHAKAILTELDRSDPQRLAKLRQIEITARKKKATALANTIAITRATARGSGALTPEASAQVLDAVLDSSRRDRDFYNGVRAIVKISNAKHDRGEDLSDTERARLVDSYHFLFNERLPALFDGCHNALWSEFEASADLENLLRLFRHSSLIWRLRELEQKEQEFIRRLAARMPEGMLKRLRGLERESSYFQARSNSLLIEQSDGLQRT